MVHVKRGHRAVRAGAILDDDRLLERRAERIGDDAADGVAGATGPEHRRNGNRPAGIIVGVKPRGRQHGGDRGYGDKKQLSHAWSLP